MCAQENEGDPPGSSVGVGNGKEEYRDKRAALRGANDEFKYQEHQRYAVAVIGVLALCACWWERKTLCVDSTVCAV